MTEMLCFYAQQIQKVYKENKTNSQKRKNIENINVFVIQFFVKQ